MKRQDELGYRDLVDGFRRSSIWLMLGWSDIRLRYRRSMLGPFWVSITMGVLVLTLGLLYGTLFKLDLTFYLPYLCLGYVIWGLIASIINEGCGVFVSGENIIRQVKLPASIFVLRMIWRNFIVFLHTLVVYLFVAIYFRVAPDLGALLAIPALILILANGAWLALLLGMICARFRDVQPIVASVMQISFFLTPVLWSPKLLAERAFLVDWNPFYHFIEILRGPLLGSQTSALSWLVAGGALVAGSLVTIAIFVRFRSRIPFWL